MNKRNDDGDDDDDKQKCIQDFNFGLSPTSEEYRFWSFQFSIQHEIYMGMKEYGGFERHIYHIHSLIIKI